MGKFYLHDGQHLISVGECSDGMEQHQVWGGHTLGLGDPPPTMKFRPVPDPMYDKRRAEAYPPIGDQLDAIWKLVESLGDDAAPARDMLTKIQAVKNRFPKRSN